MNSFLSNTNLQAQSTLFRSFSRQTLYILTSIQELILRTTYRIFHLAMWPFDQIILKKSNSFFRSFTPIFTAYISLPRFFFILFLSYFNTNQALKIIRPFEPTAPQILSSYTSQFANLQCHQGQFTLMHNSTSLKTYSLCIYQEFNYTRHHSTTHSLYSSLSILSSLFQLIA